MSPKAPAPLPLFDTLEQIQHSLPLDHLAQHYCLEDIHQALAFLKAYKGSQGTFNSYRREIERLIHWCALIHRKTLKDLKRESIESYISFCQNPPKTWIGDTKPPRFVEKDGQRLPNPKWRPFISTVSKAARRKGSLPDKQHFDLSHGSLRELFAILSSFFSYLLQEEYVFLNPIALIRQKSQFLRKAQGQPKIRRLSELQWQTVIKSTQALALQDPEKHERSLFILSALYALYLRISELTASVRWIPMMNHFHRDGDNNWWFTTVGKGNKERQIAVSDAMLEALKRWRLHLNLSSFPSPADNSPLLPKNKGKGPITHTNTIRQIVQTCFDHAITQLHREGLGIEAETLHEATVHWLRHTGISDDVKIRPREHVRDDAGHSSSAITDKYIDIELRERHRSAKKKRLFEND